MYYQVSIRTAKNPACVNTAEKLHRKGNVRQSFHFSQKLLVAQMFGFFMVMKISLCNCIPEK